MPTGRDIVSEALKELGVLRAGDTARAEHAMDGLTRLNRWLDSLALDRFSMQAKLRTTKTLTADVASYTIGTGGSINIARPTFVEDAGLILDTTDPEPIERPVRVLSDQEWAEVRRKTQSGTYVEAIYFDRSWSSGLGVIYVTPVPDGGTTQLVLYTPLAATQFADLNTSYSLPTGYKELFVMGLATLLAPQFGVRLDPDGVIITAYTEAKERLGIANLQVPILKPDTGTVFNRSASRYDIFSNR